MERKIIVSALMSFTIYFLSCQSGNQNNSLQPDSATKPVVINPADNVPQYRKEIRKEAVAQYKEKTDNPLNDWYFSVALFETPKTFHYLLKLQFEELTGEDTLKLPDFGYQPKPLIQKGKEKYSCIIGFMDNENKFREYKLVHVDGGNRLKVTTLKHYAVATYQE
jgi:hypothetical protein